MRSLLATSLLAGALLVGAPAANAGTPRASVKTLRAAATQQVEVWRQAGIRVARIRTRASELAGRIDTLKRSKRQPGELQRLLEVSLAAESTLERALAAQSAARDDVERTVRIGVSRIDSEIRALVPQLKTGPIVDRRAAARRINELRGSRTALRRALTTLEAEVGRSPRDWSRYQVRVEPLDGPVELAEKADFVEDTRDKLAKKRRAIAKLLQEAKEERQIARAARDFDTYVRIFDEEARSDRVTRRQRGNEIALAANEPGATRGGADPVEDSATEAFSNNGRGTEAPNITDGPPNVGNSADDKLGSGQTPTGPTVNTPDTSAAPVARDINADVLINLRVSQLAAQDLDLPTLLRLVEELEDLDEYLADQASSIRKRARALEADEAKDLRR